MPSGHRRGRYYCSSTCRVRAHEWRRSPEGQATKAEQEARLKEWLASEKGQAFESAMKLAVVVSGGEEQRRREGERAARFKRAAMTGETCAKCGRDLEGECVVFLHSVLSGESYSDSSDFGNGESYRRAVVCPECSYPDDFSHRNGRCEKPHLCEKCRPGRGSWEYDPLLGSEYVQRWYCKDAGENHPDEFCRECHPVNWQEERCRGCERVIMFRPHGNRRLDENGTSIVFCSVRCRTLVNRTEAATRRTERRLEEYGTPRCEVCEEVIDGRRWGTRYCSSACRQRAYRERRR
jgi:hypothetical protein